MRAERASRRASRQTSRRASGRASERARWARVPRPPRREPPNVRSEFGSHAACPRCRRVYLPRDAQWVEVTRPLPDPPSAPRGRPALGPGPHTAPERQVTRYVCHRCGTVAFPGEIRWTFDWYGWSIWVTVWVAIVCLGVVFWTVVGVTVAYVAAFPLAVLGLRGWPLRIGTVLEIAIAVMAVRRWERQGKSRP